MLGALRFAIGSIHTMRKTRGAFTGRCRQCRWRLYANFKCCPGCGVLL